MLLLKSKKLKQEKDCCLIVNTRLMKKVVSFLWIVVLFASCKDEVITKPVGLIEKGKMMNVMYDVAVLEAIKYQNPSSLTANKINTTEYIYTKFKIDSLQYAQSNVYYAANYKEYKEMYDEVGKRIDKQKTVVDSIIKLEKKKTKIDSIKAAKKPILKIEDSIGPNHRELLPGKEGNRNALRMKKAN